jgi:hypothetical protein
MGSGFAMTTLLTINLCTLATVLFFMVGGVRFVLGVLRAPEGYEDEGGFHYAEEGAAGTDVFESDLGRKSLHV